MRILNISQDARFPQKLGDPAMTTKLYLSLLSGTVLEVEIIR